MPSAFGSTSLCGDSVRCAIADSTLGKLRQTHVSQAGLTLASLAITFNGMRLTAPIRYTHRRSQLQGAAVHREWNQQANRVQCELQNSVSPCPTHPPTDSKAGSAQASRQTDYDGPVPSAAVFLMRFARWHGALCLSWSVGLGASLLPGLAEIWIGPVGAADWLVKWMEPAWTGLVRCLGRESNAIAYAFAMAVGYGYGYIRSGTLKVLDGFAVAGLWTG